MESKREGINESNEKEVKWLKLLKPYNVAMCLFSIGNNNSSQLLNNEDWLNVRLEMVELNAIMSLCLFTETYEPLHI